MNPANQMIQKIIKLLPILIGSSALLAQNYQGKISSIKESGLHQIVLSPDVIAATRNNTDFIKFSIPGTMRLLISWEMKI